MTQTEWLYHATTIGLVVISISATIFPILYGLRSSWWMTKLGATFLALMSSHAIILNTRLVFRLLPNENRLFAFWVMTIETMFAAIFTTLLTLHLFRIQQRSRKDSKYDDTDARPFTE